MDQCVHTLSWRTPLNEWFSMRSACTLVCTVGAQPPTQYANTDEGLTLKRNRPRLESTDEIRRIPTTLGGLRCAVLTPASCLIALAFRHFASPAARARLPLCSALQPFHGKANYALVESKAHGRNTAAYWAPRSASRLSNPRWHWPLFVLAQRIETAFLSSAPSRLFTVFGLMKECDRVTGAPL